MEAILLMLEVIGISQVLIWVSRGRGNSGLFAWKDAAAPASDGAARTRRIKRGD